MHVGNSFWTCSRIRFVDASNDCMGELLANIDKKQLKRIESSFLSMLFQAGRSFPLPFTEKAASNIVT